MNLGMSLEELGDLNKRYASVLEGLTFDQQDLYRALESLQYVERDRQRCAECRVSSGISYSIQIAGIEHKRTFWNNCAAGMTDAEVKAMQKGERESKMGGIYYALDKQASEVYKKPRFAFYLCDDPAERKREAQNGSI